MDRVLAVVIRQSSDENTVAIVSCDKTDRIDTPLRMHKGIYDAITKWVITSKEGLEEFERNGDDFNVGDLANNCGDEKLTEILADFGVNNLTVETYSQSYPFGWDYDDMLLDNGMIPD